MTYSAVFPHHRYCDAPPASPFMSVRAEAGPEAGSPAFYAAMAPLGDQLRRAGVSAVYLVHGTFVGMDVLGILGELARVMPRAGNAMRRLVAQVVTQITGDAGNYSAAYARIMHEALNPPGSRPLPVRLFHWSGENHHLGRADGAIRLLAELADHWHSDGSRVLLWGHSHGGNIFALISNLLAGPREAIDRFFRATEVYWRWPVLKCVDIPVWNQVRQMLMGETRCPIDARRLDFVTFGTPVRYGWNPAGFGRLLHFVHHRPVPGLPEYRAPFPPKWHRVVAGADGDYVQQLGIAGTDFMPSVLFVREWLADHRLRSILCDENIDAGGMLQRFRAGRIVPDAGTTLLVDYGPPQGGPIRHLAGHAVYTRKKWMLFHLEESVRRLYQQPESAESGQPAESAESRTGR